MPCKTPLTEMETKITQNMTETPISIKEENYS